MTVTKATPSLSTKRLPASAKVGTAIADKATVSAGYHPSGKVTFRLYKNKAATGTPRVHQHEVALARQRDLGYVQAEEAWYVLLGRHLQR